MVFPRPAVLAMVLLCCFSAPGGAAPARDATKQETAMRAFRNYALSSCLRQGFPAIADEADAAKDTYLQNGIHPGEAYQAIQTMAAAWLQRSYPSFRDVKLTMVKCIDFADSLEVARLGRRTLPHN